jgi:hypothetical protein
VQRRLGAPAATGPAWAKFIGRRDREYFTLLCWGDREDAVRRELIRKGLLTEQHYKECLT